MPLDRAYIKLSVKIHGRPTSTSLEPRFIAELKRIAAARGVSMQTIVEEVDDKRQGRGRLSSWLRNFVMSEILKEADAAERAEAQANAPRPAVQ